MAVPRQFIVFALSTSDPTDFHLGYEVAQPNGQVTVERTYEAMEPQDDGSMKLSNTLSIQEDGTIGWRPKGTAGPFELANKADGFYLYGPGIRLHGDLKLPVYPVARFEEFVL
jgi:hypothetical protein